MAKKIGKKAKKAAGNATGKGERSEKESLPHQPEQLGQPDVKCSPFRPSGSHRGRAGVVLPLSVAIQPACLSSLPVQLSHRIVRVFI